MMAGGACNLRSWGRGRSGMAMKSLTYSMLAIFHMATCIVEPVMKKRLTPKYQSITFLSVPLENWRGTRRFLFLVPVFKRREALGQ